MAADTRERCSVPPKSQRKLLRPSQFSHGCEQLGSSEDRTRRLLICWHQIGWLLTQESDVPFRQNHNVNFFARHSSPTAANSLEAAKTALEGFLFVGIRSDGC